MAFFHILVSLFISFSTLQAQGVFDSFNSRWGVIDGRLIDTFEDVDPFGTRGGTLVGGAGVGVGVGIGIGVGGVVRPGFPGSLQNLLPCRQSVCSGQLIYPPRCEFKPVLTSSLTGRYCLGCPVDICRDTGVISGRGGAGAGTGRRQRRRMRRIQRQACRHLGICNFGNQLVGRSDLGLGAGVVAGAGVATGYRGRSVTLF